MNQSFFEYFKEHFTVHGFTEYLAGQFSNPMFWVMVVLYVVVYSVIKATVDHVRK